MTERWLPVVGYEGTYEVSDQGRVRSLDRVILRAGRQMRLRGQILAPGRQSKREHLQVNLHREGRGKSFSVHGLVLTAFVGPRAEGMEGCHYDGDPTNNCLSNLRWDTRTGNVRDAVRHGTLAQMRRSACPRGHALSQPNLRAVPLSRGHRQCLACHRASAARQRLTSKGLLFDMKAESDRRYAAIMAAAA